MGETALIVSIASAGVAAYGQWRAGEAVAASEALSQAQIKSQQSQAQAKALDDELIRRRQLAITLGEQEAIGAQSGLGTFMTGSSFLALRQDSQRAGREDIERIRLLGANENARLTSEFFASRLRAKEAQKTAGIQAFTTLLGGAAQASSLGSGLPNKAPVIDKGTQAGAT